MPRWVEVRRLYAHVHPAASNNFDFELVVVCRSGATCCGGIGGSEIGVRVAAPRNAAKKPRGDAQRNVIGLGEVSRKETFGDVESVGMERFHTNNHARSDSAICLEVSAIQGVEGVLEVPRHRACRGELLKVERASSNPYMFIQLGT